MQKIQSFFSQHYLAIILILASVVGLVYVFMVPPWMHHDEPGHFEYAWLIANQNTLPEQGDYNQYMRREVAASMMEHGFADYTGVSVNPNEVSKPVDILYLQTGDQPLYYLLVSLPLRLIKNTDIAFQLYIGRLVSFLLFMITIWAAYKTSFQIFGSIHPMRWMLPLFMVSLPGFTDIMSAVNNDVGAIAAFSLFVWASVILITQGYTLKRLVFLLLTMGACYLSKSTAFVAVPLGVLVLIFTCLKGKKPLYTGLVLALLTLSAILLSFSWKATSPAYFYNTANQSNLLRIEKSESPLGNYILKQINQPFFTMLTNDATSELAGNTATFGAWIWSDQPRTINWPTLERLDMKGVIFNEKEVEINEEPKFYTTLVDFPEGDYVAWLEFPAVKNGVVFWDGMILIPGNFSGGQVPYFSSKSAEWGSLEGKVFNNQVRNGSFESAWPVFSNLLNKLISTPSNFNASKLLTLFDLESSAWYYRASSWILFRSFWGGFEWGVINPIGMYTYQMILVLSILAVSGSAISSIFGWKQMPRKLLLFFILAIVLELGIVYMRGSATWFSQRTYPRARYFLPVIIPASTMLVWGWYQWPAVFLKKKATTLTFFGATMFILFTIALQTWGILGIYNYFWK